MSAAALLEQAQAAGVLLLLDDGHLTWEADHEPPGELLEEIRTHRLEIIEALSEANDPLAKTVEWLASLAILLRCTPSYLLEHGYVDRHDLAEQCHIHPRFAARLIRTHPNWCQPSEHSSREGEEMPAPEMEEFRAQYARAREESFANPHLSAAWIVARDAYHRHALGGCPNCYPRGNRHCCIGIELRARYDHENHALEVRNAEGEA